MTCNDSLPVTVIVDGGGAVCTDPDNTPVCTSPNYGNGNQVIVRNEYSAKSCNQVCCTDGGLDTAILWCNWCALSGATVTATGTINGTDPRMACECDAGVFWQFANVATYEIELEKEWSFDSVVISDHDLCEVGATIKVFADGNQVSLMSHTNREAIIAAEDCTAHDFKCGCNDIGIYLPECKLAKKVTIEIESIGARKIDRIFVGQSIELTLEPGFQNPFNASRWKSDYKESGNCILSPTVKRIPRDSEVVFTDIDSETIKHEMRPLFNYMAHYPVHFALSRTTCPDDLALVVLRDDGVGPTTYGDNPCIQTVSMPLRFFINGC